MHAQTDSGAPLALKDQRTNDHGLTKMAVDAATVRAAVETAGDAVAITHLSLIHI